MYLLDTNILSALALGKNASAQDNRVRRWLIDVTDDLYISTISVAEIEAGIAKLSRQGATRKAGELTDWLNGILTSYRDRIVPLDLPAARMTGLLLDRAIGAGGDPDFEDAAIAACAVVSDMTVVTRNARHFQLFDVPFIDPYQSLPQ